MKKAIKTTTNIIAYCLGNNAIKEKELIAEGKIRKISKTSYELHTSESDNKGELAVKGDYFKIDNHGNPYPNNKEWFEKNHIFVKDNVYNQIVKPVVVWDITKEIIPEIDYIVKTGKLLINKNDDKKYFTARLWGTILSAPKDSFILIRNIEIKTDESTQNVYFDFIAKDVFEQTYQYV